MFEDNTTIPDPISDKRHYPIVQVSQNNLAFLSRNPPSIFVHHLQVNIFRNDVDSAIAVATAKGPDRAREAAERILSDPIIADFKGKPAVLVLHLLAGDDLTLYELDNAASTILDNWGSEIDMTYGTATDPGRNGNLRLGMLVGLKNQNLQNQGLYSLDQALN